MSETQLKATLEVQGMTCGSCQRHVSEALQEISGVEGADVDLRTGRATVTYDPQQTDTQAMIGAITEAGYHGEVASDAASLPVQSGCGCSGCA